MHYQDLYPGIDLVYYGNQRELEYDFVVRPGADPTRIAIEFTGADRLEIDADGDLLLHTGSGVIRQRKPVIYQELDGVHREILGGYVPKSARRVGFRVADYDTTRPLIIDPTLFYSTYLGGGSYDAAAAIAVDTTGNAYVAGFTFSTDFPTTAGAFDTSFNGSASEDGFVTKLNSTGSGLVYSTYLGGDSLDIAFAIAVDATGSAYVAGLTSSSDFPTTVGAFQSAFGGSFHDAFVTKLSPTGSAVVYSTYLGGAEPDGASGLALDSAGNAHVTGTTESPNFPTTATAFDTTANGITDVFITKLNATGTLLVYSTFLGGNSSDLGGEVVLDSLGNAYITGSTNSTNFPTTIGAFQIAFGGTLDAFATKLTPTGSALVYSTYLGGNAIEQGHSIAVDIAGNTYVAGRTSSVNFPATAGAFQTSLGGTSDAFVTKLGPSGSTLVYSTYLGGTNADFGFSIAINSAGEAYVTGFTSSPDFPTIAGAFQTVFGGFDDAFVTKLSPTGSGLMYSTYLGGTGVDFGISIALDALPDPNAYVVGETDSTDFPTTPGAFQPVHASPGDFDAFVAQITDVAVPPGPFSARVTGGGTIDVVGGIANFHFIVQRQTDGTLSGRLQYLNHATGAKVRSEMITSLTIVGNTATFDGTCTVNGAPCTLTVNVTDNGEPGTTDTFTISVDSGPPEGGILRSGNILIQQ